jgi:hypothetical protein
VRTAADKVRKAEKEQYTVGANAIQGMFNVLKFGTTPMEEVLKNIETHYEQIEAEKKRLALQKLMEKRKELLVPYPLAYFDYELIQKMSIEVFDKHLVSVRAEDRIRIDKIESDRLEAEKIVKAEADKLEEKIREDERGRISIATGTTIRTKLPDLTNVSRSVVFSKDKPAAEQFLKTEKAKIVTSNKILDRDSLEKIASVLSEGYEFIHSEIASRAIKRCIDIIFDAKEAL